MVNTNTNILTSLEEIKASLVGISGFLFLIQSDFVDWRSNDITACACERAAKSYVLKRWCCRTLLELVRYVALLADLSGCSGLCTGAET